MCSHICYLAEADPGLVLSTLATPFADSEVVAFDNPLKVKKGFCVVNIRLIFIFSQYSDDDHQTEQHILIVMEIRMNIPGSAVQITAEELLDDALFVQEVGCVKPRTQRRR